MECFCRLLPFCNQDPLDLNGEAALFYRQAKDNESTVRYSSIYPCKGDKGPLLDNVRITKGEFVFLICLCLLQEDISSKLICTWLHNHLDLKPFRRGWRECANLREVVASSGR
jgi:hypothetical protein